MGLFIVTHVSPQFSGSRHPNQYRRVGSKPGFPGGGSAGGAVVGVILSLVSCYLLFTNEAHAVQTAASVREGLAEVVSLDKPLSVDEVNNNRLVHLSAQLQTSQPLHDPNYNVVVHAVKLRRQVEMYQWVEQQQSNDVVENGETKTETTYSYNTEWKSELVNSRNFDKEIGHENPSAMAVESATVVAPEVKVGPFTLSKGLVEQIDDFHVLSLKDLSALNVVTFLTVHDDYLYHTDNVSHPQVGDVRVRFSFAGLSSDTTFLGPAQTVSVVAKQRGGQLIPYKTRSGDALEILYEEDLSAGEVFERELQYNSKKTWGLRLLGWFLMFLGIQLAMRIIYTLVDWIPLLRELVSVGLTIFSLCISSSLSLLIIGFGWLFYRPLVAVALGALAMVPVFLARSRLPAKKHQ
ncbi:transmembrane protein 43-like [Synchiropus splendidus]|uniref:transmembrane protein 43-like n=1 Tax=Synchiropus splendidus TaxID=270530 RepID=UPI00237DD588|nr:transmembrane protein 43-like [Synchiropus splendidus]